MSCRLTLTRLASLACLATLSMAHAQPAPKAARPDPLDPQAAVPPLVHSSALLGYRGLGEDKLLPWKQANETVNRIGGWRTYARKAAAESASAPAADAPPGHGGHPPK